MPMMKGVGEQLTSVAGSGWSAAGRKGMNVPEKERGESVCARAAAVGISLATADETSRRGRSKSAARKTITSCEVARDSNLGRSERGAAQRCSRQPPRRSRTNV